ncbi:helicase associated domain-containing protein, partial [Streptomyces exfoliatus]|uniref:helicase associated domain-containing protein n=1 Tax=Streptomyces exfoliatus TaxID=1905 RepID=UPI0037A82F4D
RAGELQERRKTLLDAPEAGMVWEPGEEAWENRLAALRSYHRATGHLAPRQDAVWGEGEGEGLVPVGQHMANLRRKGGLGKEPERAAARAEQLAKIDPDWNCPWPLDWQRHYKVLADLAADEVGGVLPDIQPGVLMDGDDIGRWLQQQRKPGTWKQLSAEQQKRLTKLGVQPDQTPTPEPAAPRSAKGASKAQQAFQRGLTALAQYVAREGEPTVKRTHREKIFIDGQEHDLALGIWYSNQKQRRDKLTQEQLNALAELGIEWA